MYTKSAHLGMRCTDNNIPCVTIPDPPFSYQEMVALVRMRSSTDADVLTEFLDPNTSLKQRLQADSGHLIRPVLPIALACA